MAFTSPIEKKGQKKKRKNVNGILHSANNIPVSELISKTRLTMIENDGFFVESSFVLVFLISGGKLAILDYRCSHIVIEEHLLTLSIVLISSDVHLRNQQNLC